jgi:hypothetical protein
VALKPALAFLHTDQCAVQCRRGNASRDLRLQKVRMAALSFKEPPPARLSDIRDPKTAISGRKGGCAGSRAVFEPRAGCVDLTERHVIAPELRQVPQILCYFPLPAASATHISPLNLGVYWMAKKSKRRTWTATDVRTLKSHAKKKTRATNIARALKRTEGATRQKAFSMGISLDSR